MGFKYIYTCMSNEMILEMMSFTHMKFLVVALGIFLALGFGFELVFQILHLAFKLFLGTLSSLSLFPLIFQLGLELSDMLGEVATKFLDFLFLG